MHWLSARRLLQSTSLFINICGIVQRDVFAGAVPRVFLVLPAGLPAAHQSRGNTIGTQSEMKKQEDIAAAILAGGKSTRMGRDKALLELSGKPFIQRVAEVLQGVFSQVVVVSDHGKQYAFLGLPVVEDTYKNCGPLGGMHAALSKTGADAVFFCSCDVPFLSADLIRYVVNRKLHDDVTLVLGGNSLQPLCGVYKKSCLTVIDKQLKRGNYSVHKCITKLHTTILSQPSEYRNSTIHPLTNINTPADYERCLKASSASRV